MIPSVPIRFWEYFDALSIGVLVVVIFSLIISHHRRVGGVLSTISKTVAYSPRTSLIFSIAMTVFFPLYYAFLWLWVGPLVRMPVLFYIVLLLSAMCELLFVWMPAKGKTDKVHAVAAGLVGLMMFILPIIMIVYGAGIGTLGKIGLISFLVIGSCVCFILLAKRVRHHIFQIEIIYCAAFLIAMSLVAHGYDSSALLLSR